MQTSASTHTVNFEPLDTIVAGARVYFNPRTGEYALVSKDAFVRVASIQHLFAFMVMTKNRGQK